MAVPVPARQLDERTATTMAIVAATVTKISEGSKDWLSIGSPHPTIGNTIKTMTNTVEEPWRCRRFLGPSNQQTNQPTNQHHLILWI